MLPLLTYGGEKRLLSLQETVKMANDSSLATFRYRNLYAAGYWEWRTFKANRLPSVSLNVMPARYYRYITQRYNYEENVDVFRPQQMYLASAGLTASQNVDFLGGTLYLDSDLEFMRNFGDYTGNQYSSVPIRLGYRQDLIGYNEFKWNRKIEPLKYEKAKKELIYNMETVSEEVVRLFFTLALAQTEYKLASENVASCDTLYSIGERRFKIASISQAELLTLKLDKVNAENSLENARISIKKGMFALASYLGLDKDSEIEVIIPGKPMPLEVPMDIALENARLNNPELMGHRQSILEAEKDVSRTGAEKNFNASINASVGFNQVATSLSGSYHNLLRQDLVSISLSIPLVDWGVRKGKYNIAKNNLNIARIAARQDELNIEQDVIITVNEFQTQISLVESALEALDLADMAYYQTRQRFIIGKADISSLTLSHNRQQEASRNYITALQNYWAGYFKIRRLTLYDFEFDIPISAEFDNIMGVH